MISNLQYAARNNERVMIGGGEFGPGELKLAAGMLERYYELFDIVKKLGKLSDGLANGNSSAEYMATELANRARVMVQEIEQ